MSEEDLELLVTLDDPGEEDLKVDTFDHAQTEKTVAYSGQPLPPGWRPDQPTETAVDNDLSTSAESGCEPNESFR